MLQMLFRNRAWTSLGVELHKDGEGDVAHRDLVELVQLLRPIFILWRSKLCLRFLLAFGCIDVDLCK